MTPHGNPALVPVERSASTLATPTDAGALRLRDVQRIGRRNRWIVAVVTGAALATAALATWLQTPIYEGETILRFSGDSRPVSAGLERLAAMTGMGALAGGSASPITTAVPVLSSRTLAESVVDSLALQLELEAPARPRSEVFRTVHVQRDASPAAYVLDLQGDGRYSVRRAAGGAARGDAAQAQIGVPFSVDGTTLELAPALADDPPAQVRFAVRSRRAAVADLRKELVVANAGAQVLSLAFTSPDPELAAAVPNTLAANFIGYVAQNTASESASSVEFLHDQVATYQRELAAAEVQLREFREAAQVVSPSQEAASTAGRLADLRIRRDEIIAERESLRELLAQAQQASGTDSSPYRRLASFPVFFANPAVQSLIQALIPLENRRAELLVLRTPQNDEVQALTGRIREIEQQLYQTAQSYLRSRDVQLASLEDNLARFSARASSVPQRELDLARREREVKLLNEIYTMLQLRLKEAQIGSAAERNDIRVLDAALVPTRPARPRPVINLGLGLVLGLMLSAGIVFLREITDPKVRDSRDLPDATAGLPLLGTLPQLASGTPHRYIGNHRARIVPPETRLVTRSQPTSAAAEAFRSLRTNIVFAGDAGRRPQVIVFTSAMPGDGKSTTAANLCVTFAQQGTRTLLVDCDLRMGALHTLLHVPAEPGVAEVLAGERSLADAVREIPIPGSPTPLFFLDTGARPTHAAELIGSPAMDALLTELRGRFDVIVLDTPPLGLVTDAAVLSTRADATILVARAGTTDKAALEAAAAQLRRLNARIQGIVLADADGAIPASAYESYFRGGRPGAGPA